MGLTHGGAKRIGESGKVTLSDTIDAGVSTTVNFSSKYRRPVVFTFVNTNNDGRAIQARTRNVTSSSCEIFVHRDDNGFHPASETVSYFVVEEGIHLLDKDCVIEVGSINTSTVYDKILGKNSSENVSLAHQFSQTPVIIHSLITYNNQAFMSSMIRSPSTTSFSIQQNSLEAQSPSTEEKIAWAAVTPGSFSKFEARREADAFSDNPKRINFTKQFTSTPDIIVKGNDIDGRDGYFMRGTGNLTNSYIDVFTEEDTINDGDTGHTSESPVFVAIEPNTVFFRDYGFTNKGV